MSVGLVRLGGQSSIFAYAACILVGVLVGLFCGRLPWRAETIWTPVLKVLVGAILGALGCYATRRFLPGLNMQADVPSFAQAFLGAKAGKLTLNAAELTAPVIGVLYGIFVEVDDGSSKGEPLRAVQR